MNKEYVINNRKNIRIKRLVLVATVILLSYFATAQDTIFNYNSLWTTFYYLNEPINPHYLDTTIQYFHRFNPAESTFGYLHIGQLGAPATSKFFNPQFYPSFDIGFHEFDIYWLNSSEMRFYDSKHPYTSIEYQQGTRNEILGSFTHTQNIIPQLSVGVELKRLRTDGFYQRQLSRITNFDVFTRYTSLSGVYHVNVGYILNSIKVDENGGLVDQNIFRDTSVFDKSLVDVRLDSAFNHWKNDEVVVENSFDFGKFDTVKKNDSVTQKVVQPRLRLSHLFEWERRSFVFTDAAIDSLFYQHIYLDSVQTRDTLKYDRYSNQLNLRLFNAKEVLLRNLSADIYFRYDIYQIKSHLPYNEVTSGIGGAVLQKSIAFDTSRLNQLILKLDGAYNFLGYDKDDYFVRAQAILQLNKTAAISGMLMQSRHQQSYISQDYLSNHFQWHNTFQPLQTSSARFSFSEYKWRVALGGEIFRVNNYLYWNSNALPAQYGGLFDGFEVFLEKDFRLGKFHLDNELQYQGFNTDTIISYPQFFLWSSLYFEGDLFKGALMTKMGIEVNYTSDYYAPAYMPETGQFFVQRVSLLHYYPVADFFVSIKIKSVRAFASVQHLDMGLFEAGYFSAYRYPMPDRSFRIGLEWRFWN